MRLKIENAERRGSRHSPSLPQDTEEEEEEERRGSLKMQGNQDFYLQKEEEKEEGIGTALPIRVQDDEKDSTNTLKSCSTYVMTG